MQKFYAVLVVYLMLYINVEPVLTEEVQREKRDVGTVVTIIAGLLPQIYELIREILKLKCGKNMSANMVNSLYNNNMENTEELQVAISSRMAEAVTAVHMSASGFNCDAAFCEEVGPNGAGTLGICSKQYCVCNNGTATLHKCGFWRVYDPMNNKCCWKLRAILCH